MKKLIYAVAILLLLTSVASAQETFIGVREGTSLWLNKSYYSSNAINLYPQRFTWDKQVLLRRNTRGKWSWEAGIKHYKTKDIITTNNLEEPPRQTVVDNHLQADMTVQYDVTYPLTGYFFPVLRDMRTYLGLSIIPVMQFTQNKATREKGNSFMLMSGLTYTHTIPVGKRLLFSSVLTFRALKGDRQKYNTTDVTVANRNISYHAGIAYKLGE